MIQDEYTPTYRAKFRECGAWLFQERRSDYSSEIKPVQAGGENDTRKHLNARKRWFCHGLVETDAHADLFGRLKY